MISETRIPLGLQMNVSVRSRLHTHRPYVVFSSGYGRFGFDEPLQLEVIKVLDRLAIGWVQYEYAERTSQSGMTDLLISSGLNALRSVCRWARAEVSAPLGLFGISFGGNISLEAALLERPSMVFVVNPVFDYVDYREQQLGEAQMLQWARDGVTAIQYERTVQSYYRFVDEARRQALMERVRDVPCRLIACQGSADPILGTRYLEELAKACPRAATHVIDGADHAMHEPHDVRQVAALAEGAAGEWLDSLLAARAA
jgi:pimeloyl-ACP methyl ester carboxylesterase